MSDVSTKEKLAAALKEHGLHELAGRALAGAYDDYESESATPQTDLIRDLLAAGCKEFAARVAAGEFDSTREEAEAWFQKEGKDLL